MISGFYRHAHSMEAMILIGKMQQVTIHPEEITYVSVLSARGRMGLVDIGQKYFELMMMQDQKVHPAQKKEKYTLMFGTMHALLIF